jgi:hypothetical protein
MARNLAPKNRFVLFAAAMAADIFACLTARKSFCSG